MTTAKTQRRIAVVSTYLPRRCGLATFAHDLVGALRDAEPNCEVDVIAVGPPNSAFVYPPIVAHALRNTSIASYHAAASFINNGGYDVVSLQFEHGIFGDSHGEVGLEFLRSLRVPVVTTLHSDLDRGFELERRVLRGVVAASDATVAMTDFATQRLIAEFDGPVARIVQVPHGVPDLPYAEPGEWKDRLGLGDRPVVLNFGLLARHKGVATAIEAIAKVRNVYEDVLFVVAGPTSATELAQHGEGFRHSLQDYACRLGLDKHVRFDDKFIVDEELHQLVQACDVLLTPYSHYLQGISGTLSYGLAAGKAVISTPFPYAQEMLSAGAGVLVPFNDAAALAAAITRILGDNALRTKVRHSAHERAQNLLWRRVGARYLSIFDKVQAKGKQ
ncbi:glycosyltransferase [Salinispora cortesiana]|uniref:glycosyltransferase n=1 Tax=Salinispora cortesiana TaxID=1305843 RepID=UPI00165F5DB8|nr:glycosyltransferase [Salinispora cortesiana]